MKRINVSMNLLGNGTVFVNQRPVTFKMGGLTTPWALFSLLALANGEYVPIQELAQALWPGCEDGSSTLRNTVSRLRAELERDVTAKKHKSIEAGAGGYRLGKIVNLEADFVDFHNHYHRLYRLRNAPFEEQFPAYCDLLSIYKGHFYCNHNRKSWTEHFSLHLGSIFYESIGEFMTLLWERSMHDEILTVYENACCHVTPCDEMRIFRYRALHILGKREEIMNDFPNTKLHYETQKDTQNPVYIEIKYIALKSDDEDRSNKVALRQVKGALGSAKKNCARVIEFDEVKRICNEQPARYTFAIFRFEIPGRKKLAARSLREAMCKFQEIALETLRGHDMIATYSEDQCLVVLPNHSENSSRAVKDRLCSLFIEKQEASVSVTADVATI